MRGNKYIMNHIWYHKNILSYFLYPLSLLYRAIICCRRFLYKINFFKTHRVGIPVIIVGNITVGGTGKTPLVIALVNELKTQGFHPGIISRGYRGKNKVWPQRVHENSDPILVGDEAVMMAKKTGVLVIVGPSRVDSARYAMTAGCDVIVSDDGLQHYALARDIEIAVIDGTRGLGNGFCLLAGPLREPQSRLNTVDFIVVNENNACNTVFENRGRELRDRGDFLMQFAIDDIVCLINETKTLHLSTRGDIYAVAGIGNPERFFHSLEIFLQSKWQCERPCITYKKIFPDHYCFKKEDFNFAQKDDVIVMTEKDAVKCAAFADERFYVVRGHADVDPDFFVSLIKKLGVI